MTSKGEGDDGKGSDYEVGYGKPPRHSRFRPGQSGNPAGRPKAVRNLATLAEIELNKLVSVREGGVVRRMTKRQALMASTVNKGLQGDLRATSYVFVLEQKAQDASQGKVGTEASTAADAADQEIIADFLARQKSSDGGGD